MSRTNPSDLVAQADRGTDGSFLIRAPAVGVVTALAKVGSHLGERDCLLTLTILGRRHPLRLPRGVQGVVRERLVGDGTAAVDFGQPLVRLSPPRALADEPGSETAAPEASGGSEDLIPVRSPSDGIFYRQPSPDSPPYVEEGSELREGTVLGLVEVMKSFNQVTYGGADVPAQARVERLLATDGAEVRFGEPLLLVRAI